MGEGERVCACVRGQYVSVCVRARVCAIPIDHRPGADHKTEGLAFDA